MNNYLFLFLLLFLFTEVGVWVSFIRLALFGNDVLSVLVDTAAERDFSISAFGLRSSLQFFAFSFAFVLGELYA